MKPLSSNRTKRKKQYKQDSDKLNINNSLPFVLQPYSPWRKIRHEVLKRHWLQPLIYGRVRDGCLYAVMRCTTALFALAVVYDIFGKAVLQCDMQHSRSTCGVGSSFFVSFLSFCRWDDASSKCTPAAIDRIASAFVMTVMGFIIFSPAVSVVEYVAFKACRYITTLSHVRNNSGFSSSVSPTADSVVPLPEGGHHLMPQSLEDELKICLTGEWTDNGPDIIPRGPSCGTATVSPLEGSTAKELERIRRLTVREYTIMQHSSPATVQHRFVFILIRDLLGGHLAADVLDAMDKSNISLPATVGASEYTAYLAATIAVVAIMAGMMVYVAVFFVKRTNTYRVAIGVSFLMWVILDCVFVAPSAVIIAHLLIPLSILSQVKEAKAELLKYTKRCHASEPSTRSAIAPQTKLNMCTYDPHLATYLVVSHRLMKLIPSLVAVFVPLLDSNSSNTIKFPRSRRLHRQQICRRQVIVDQVCLWYLGLPEYAQNSLWMILSAVIWGFIVLFHLWLYEVHRWLTILPSLFVLIILHFLTKASEHRHYLQERSELGVDRSVRDQSEEIGGYKTGGHERVSSLVEFFMGSPRPKRNISRNATADQARNGKLKGIIKSRLLGNTKAKASLASTTGQGDSRGASEDCTTTQVSSLVAASRLRSILSSRILGRDLSDSDDGDDLARSDPPLTGQHGWAWKSAVASLLTTTKGSSGGGGGPSITTAPSVDGSGEEGRDGSLPSSGHWVWNASPNMLSTVIGSSAPSAVEQKIEKDLADDRSADYPQGTAVCAFSQSPVGRCCLEEQQNEQDSDGEEKCPETFEGVVDGLEMDMPAFLDLEESNFTFHSSDSEVETGCSLGGTIMKGKELASGGAVLDDESCSVMLYEDSTTASSFILQVPLYSLKKEVISSDCDDEFNDAQEVFDSVCCA